MGDIIRFSLEENKDIIENDLYEPLPAGKYHAVLTSAEVRETKAGTGRYLNVQAKIVGEKYEGRVIFDMINFENQKRETELIGKAKFGKLILAVGLPGGDINTDELLGVTIGVKVSVEFDKYLEKKVNKIKDYLHKDSVE